MARINILTLNINPHEIERLNRLCQNTGSVYHSTDMEKAISLLESINFNVFVVDYSLANYSFFREVSKKSTSILITGIEESKIQEIVKEWPLDTYVDYHLTPYLKEDNEGFLRALTRAAEYSILKTEADKLSRSIERSEMELKEAYSEIKDIKMFISDTDAKELEKRIAIEKKYISFQKEKLAIEETLRKLYAANDVTSLLDIVYDIKDIVLAESITMYILDKSEIHGKYLKPLVWDNTFLAHAAFLKYIAPIDSQDFATSVVQYGQEINVSDFSYDKRLTKRYTENLKKPLKSLLCVPIMYDKEVIGALEVYNKIQRRNAGKARFTKGDQQTLRRFSEHIAIAITKLNLIQYDALTGLLRPDPFFDRVLQKLKPSTKKRQEKGSYAMVLSDVDWFKNYNDRNGHESGNRLLRELANVLKSPIRDDDLLCRYGGEEFLYFLSGLKDLNDALRFTERIRKKVEEHYFEYQEFQPRNNLTMSFGVAPFTREYLNSLKSITKNNLKKLVNEADMALARAKGKKTPDSGEEEGDESFPVKNTICGFYRKKTDKAEEVSFIRLFKDKLLKERRKNERYYASTICIYRSKTIQKVTKTINLSIDGARIPTESEFPIDQPLDLILILGNEVCQLKSDVVYSTKIEGESPYYNTGVKFKDLSDKNRKILENFFLSLRKK